MGGSSQDPEPQPGIKGGQRPRKVKGQTQWEVRSPSKRKETGREPEKRGRGNRGERLDRGGGEECQGEGGRVPGLASGHGGSLRASRVFTNEGSKKEKRGLKGQANFPGRGKGPGKSSILSPPQQGRTMNGRHLSREEVSAPGPPSAMTTPSGAPTPVGLEESKHSWKMGTPGGSQHHPRGNEVLRVSGRSSPPVYTPAQSTAQGALAGNLSASNLRLQFGEWTELTGLCRLKALGVPRDQGESTKV